MNSKSVGERSEGIILAKFLQRGWTVLMPFGDNQRYDLVIDRGNGFERVQVKTGKILNGAVDFKTHSTSYHRKNGGAKSYRGEIELFAIYCPDNQKSYLISIDLVGYMGASLRIEEPKNKQVKLIRWAKDFEI